MRRLAVKSILLLALTAALLTPGASAVAAPPTPADVNNTTREAGQACAFPIAVTFTGKQGFNPVPNNPQFPGGIVTAPGQMVTVTNRDTGGSVTVNTNGVFRLTPNPDGTTTIVAGGNNFLFGEPQLGVTALATTGPIKLVANLNTGRIVEPPDLSGARVRDLCAELAP